MGFGKTEFISDVRKTANAIVSNAVVIAESIRMTSSPDLQELALTLYSKGKFANRHSARKAAAEQLERERVKRMLAQARKGTRAET